MSTTPTKQMYETLRALIVAVLDKLPNGNKTVMLSGCDEMIRQMSGGRKTVDMDAIQKLMQSKCEFAPFHRLRPC
jgi:hypothetical protein